MNPNQQFGIVYNSCQRLNGNPSFGYFYLIFNEEL